jgi:penicillin-binding protein 1C
VGSAAPILFDVFNLLPRTPWFAPPYNDLEQADVCALSGHLAGEHCPVIKQWIPLNGSKTTVCPYHKVVHLDIAGQFRVNSNCESVDNMVAQSWFVLPPVMEWYYKSGHINYRPLPPYREDCREGTGAYMDFIYPREDGKIFLTKDFNGVVQPFIVKAAHTQANAKLFWYLNDTYLGMTQTFHEMPIKAKSGTYYITITDEGGNEIRRKVVIEASK